MRLHGVTWQRALLFLAICLVLLCIFLIVPMRNDSTGNEKFLIENDSGVLSLIARQPHTHMQHTFSEFVNRVLQPAFALEESFDVDIAKLDETLERMRPTTQSPLSNLLHYLYLNDLNSTVTTQDGIVPIIHLLLDGDAGAKYFRGAKPLLRSRYGARFTPYQKLMLGTDQPSAEAHLGQALSTLGSLGVSLTHPIQLQGGSPATLQDVFDDLVANFFLDDAEIFWQATALTFYLPPKRSWTNRFRENFTFDMLAKELLSRDFGESACAGTHRLIGLVTLLRAHHEMSIIEPKTEQMIVDDLSKVVKILVHSQHSNGSWTSSWHKDLVGNSIAQALQDVSSVDRIVATGHHLEWLMLLPDEIRPEDRIFFKAAGYLMSVVPELAKDPQWLTRWYCPVTHSLRSVCLLNRLSKRKGHPSN